MEDLSRDDPIYNLYLLLLKVRTGLLRAREKELYKYGLTPAQAGVLYVVQNSDHRLTPAEISRLMLREPHTVSTLLRRMQTKGLIRRSNDSERRNVVRIAITRKGREAYGHSTHRQPIYQIMSALSPEESKQLQGHLGKLMKKVSRQLGK